VRALKGCGFSRAARRFFVEEPGFSRAAEAEIEMGLQPLTSERQVSRTAAQECSPRRKPWGWTQDKQQAPKGRKKLSAHR